VALLLGDYESGRVLALAGAAVTASASVKTLAANCWSSSSASCKQAIASQSTAGFA
jgi:hypothetical protein